MTNPITYRRILAVLDENIWRGAPEIAQMLDPDAFEGFDGVRFVRSVRLALEEMIEAGWVAKIERQSDSYLRTPEGTRKLNREQ